MKKKGDPVQEEDSKEDSFTACYRKDKSSFKPWNRIADIISCSILKGSGDNLKIILQNICF